MSHVTLDAGPEVRRFAVIMMETPTLPPSPPEGPDAPQRHRRSRAVLTIVLVALGAWTLRSFLAALVWAAIIAIAIGPGYRRALRRWPSGRHVVLPLLFTLVVAVVFLLPFVLVAVQAARDAHDVISFTSEALRNGIPVPDVVSHLPFGASAVQGWWAKNIAEPAALSDLTHGVTRQLRQMPARELSIAITHRVVTFFFTLVTLFFILQNADTLASQMLTASYKLLGAAGERVARQMVASVHGTVDGLVLVGLGEGVLLGIAFAVAGVPHPTLLGAFAAVAAMIPFVIVIMLVLVAGILLAQGTVGAAIAVLAFGFVVNFIADHFIRPGLIGGATKLPFLWVLLGVLGGVEVWGLIGLFVGPALMSALMLLWREFVRQEPLLDERPPKTLSPVPIASP